MFFEGKDLSVSVTKCIKKSSHRTGTDSQIFPKYKKTTLGGVA